MILRMITFIKSRPFSIKLYFIPYLCPITVIFPKVTLLYEPEYRPSACIEHFFSIIFQSLSRNIYFKMKNYTFKITNAN